MFGSPSRRSTSGAWPPPQPSMWKAWIVRPASTSSVSSTDRHSLSPSVWTATCTSYRSATVTAVSRAVRCAPTSSWIFSPAAPASSAASSGSGRDDEPRARNAKLSGQASVAADMRARYQAGFVPRFQTGPKSWPTIVVMPLARAASAMRGESMWTCVSMAPGVAIRPSPE